MKKVMKMTAVAMVVGLVAMAALADSGWYPVSVNEGALHGGANYKLVVKHSDLTETGTNGTAQVLTNETPVAANTQLECVEAVLKTAFDGSTNLTSVTVTVGDGSDADLFLASMEVCENATEVFCQKGRGDEAAITGTTVTYTNVVYGGGDTTGNVSTVTYTAATTVYGQKLYTSAGYVVSTWTPTGTYKSLADLTSGEIWIYFRKWGN